MPARTTYTIADGETSPVNHVFSPDGDEGNNHARFINRNAAVPAASEYLFMKVSRSPSPAQMVQTPAMKVQPDIVEMRIKYPMTFTDSGTGLTLVDFVDELVLRRLCHPRSSEQRRKNLRLLVINALSLSGLRDCFEKTEAFW